MKILITGISGSLGRLVATLLHSQGHTVFGVDRRPWPDAPKGVEVVKADIRKRPAEDLFRTRCPKVVIHLATATHFTTRFEERYRINLFGTQRIFDHCHTYGVEQAIFIGRHTVYGAGPDTPLYHTENDPPMAGSTFPELADLVAADLFAASSMWRWPDLKTAVLRMAYVLGPSRLGNLAFFLKGPRVPTVLGFDPLYQFMHELDAARAIGSAMDARLHGVFNVAGPQPVPLSLLCQVTGRQAISLPPGIYERCLGHFGFPKLPAGAINHIKYPIIIDDSLFRTQTDFEHEYDEGQTMEAFRWAGAWGAG